MSACQAAPGRSAASRVAANAAARADRLAGAAQALAQPTRERIDEGTRSLLDALTRALIDGVEAELGDRLAGVLGTVTPAAFSAADALQGAGHAIDRALVAHLLRRVDEHRLIVALRRVETGLAICEGEPRDTLAEHPDPELAAAARGLAAAEAMRVDDALRPLLPLDEIEPEVLHALAWTVAGAMRPGLLTGGRGEAEVDGAAAAAVSELLGAMDHANAPAHAAVRLAERLDARGMLDDVMIVEALSAGRPLLCVAALARRARLPLAVCWDLAFDRSASQLAMLLRAVSMARDEAVAILALVHGADPSRGDEALAALVTEFDDSDAEVAERVIALWRLEPHYRDALLAVTPRG